MANRDEKYQALLEERRARREALEAAERAEKKKKTTTVVICIALAVLIIGAAVTLVLRPWEKPAEKTTVAIEVKDYGTIKVEVDPTYAPITAKNFLKLVKDGFYDGLTFHRIIEGFMIQGGDPDHNGGGGSGVNIKGEFPSNGVNNPLKHTRGVISMARSDHPDSASSQFFIMHQDAPHLDGNYAAFGKVTEGMEVVDAIAKAAEPTDNNGTIPYEKQPVITKITIID